MTNINTEGLPPEMQARIAEIIDKAKANAIQPVGATPQAAMVGQPQQAPVQRPPSLMDHVIALRQEVAALRQELHASSQVTEAVGGAVGQLYSMFFEQSQAADQSSTYASQFQQQQPSLEDDY